MKERIVKGWRRARARIKALKIRIKKLREQVKSIRNSLSFLAPLKDIRNITFFILGLIIVYGFIAQFLGWV